MKTHVETERINALVAALRVHDLAKVVDKPSDNPFANHTLDQLSHGMQKGADNFPAVNMVAKAGNSVAQNLEEGRYEFHKKGREDKSARRMAQAKARNERKVEFERIAASKFAPDPERMQLAWLVVVHLVPIITGIAKSKQAWANRLLGSNADDIPQMALEKTALVLARQEKFDLEVLQVAAEQLGQSERGIPGNQEVSEADPDHIKKVKKARKWLMGMVNNRVMGALVDSYTSVNNLRWDNLDIIPTVMASINGVGDDPLRSSFKADRAPAFLGSRFQSPGGIDGDLLAMAISAAITERGLDPLVEFILDDENRRVDGNVKWSEVAEQIFLLTPGGMGEWMWQQVVSATDSHEHGRRRRGIAARDHVRNLFAWLPSLIGTVVDSFDPHFIGWSSTGQRAVVASDFELFYLGDEPEMRESLSPALAFTSKREAAELLSEHLAHLVTGNEIVGNLVNA